MIERFEDVPQETIDTALAGVQVIFNKPIAPVSFTYEDLRLTCNGQQLDLSDVTIQQMTETAYFIHLRPVTAKNGFYVLEINMTNVVDPEGFNGLNTANMVYWTQGKENSTALDQTSQELKANSQKLIIDGILYIIRDGKTYNIFGHPVNPVPLHP